MKKFLFILITLISLSTLANAQQMRVNVYGSYVFDDKFDSYYDPFSYYNGVVEGGFQWGIGAEYMLRPLYGIELVYYRQDTKAPTTYYQNGVKFADFDLGANYIMLAGNRYFRKPGGKIEGQFGGMLGANIMSLKNPTNGRSDSRTQFAWGIRGGANYWVSPSVGIKLQAQLLSAVQSVGGGLYFGTGGISTGLSSFSTMYQFGLGGGLVFAFGGSTKPATPATSPATRY